MSVSTRTARCITLAGTMTSMLLAGCAGLSPDGGMHEVARLTQERIGQAVQKTDDVNAVGARVSQLLRAPLTADSAVEIALLNNQRLQAAFAELGVAEADWVQAGRLRNPGFSFSRVRGGEQVEIDRSVMFDLAGLLTLPLRQGVERRRFEQAQLQAAAQALQLAFATRRAYFDALAAAQAAQYMQQAQASAEAGAQLAQRMAAVGNWSKLDQAREQAFYAETTAQVARAQQHAVAAREQLTRLLGVSGTNTGFTLPERLPALPHAPRQIPDAEAQAIARRLDVLIARRDVDATAHALRLSRATRFVNVLDAGYANKSLRGEPRESGYEIALELPLFDWGGARDAKAEAMYMQAVHRTADVAVRARSEVRERYAAYRTAYDLARHYQDEVVPLRKKISDEVLLRYNGMLVGVFELLADAREQIGSVTAALDAQRDFWIADTNLQAAINGGGNNASMSMEGNE